MGVVTRARLGGQSTAQSYYVARMTEIGKWDVKGLSRDARERDLNIGEEGKCYVLVRLLVL